MNKIVLSIGLAISQLVSFQIAAQETQTKPKVEFCNPDKQYTVSRLKDFYPEQKDLPYPDKTASYKGGEKKIEKYVNKQIDLGNFEKSQIIPVYVHFEVNCNGEAGNFEVIMCDDCKNKEFFESQLIKIFNELPQNWKAAIVNNETVDSHQIIVFAINLGMKDAKKNGVTNLSYADKNFRN